MAEDVKIEILEDQPAVGVCKAPVTREFARVLAEHLTNDGWGPRPWDGLGPAGQAFYAGKVYTSLSRAYLATLSKEPTGGTAA